MMSAQMYNDQPSRPEILERLSEIEDRDRERDGGARPASDPRGWTVVNTTGHDVGRVEDLYVDPHTRQPLFALLALGNHMLGFGDRKVLVRFDDIDCDGTETVRVRAAM